MTKMSTRLQRLEAIVRQQEDARFAQWLRSCTDEELMCYITDEMREELKSLKTLSNEQLIQVANGEPLSAVLNQERKPA
jgi:hypothetical protein